jgi:hypothetical protein
MIKLKLNVQHENPTYTEKRELDLPLATAKTIVLELVQQIVEHQEYEPGDWASQVIKELA